MAKNTDNNTESSLVLPPLQGSGERATQTANQVRAAWIEELQKGRAKIQEGVGTTYSKEAADAAAKIFEEALEVLVSQTTTLWFLNKQWTSPKKALKVLVPDARARLERALAAPVEPVEPVTESEAVPSVWPDETIAALLAEKEQLVREHKVSWDAFMALPDDIIEGRHWPEAVAEASLSRQRIEQRISEINSMLERV